MTTQQGMFGGGKFTPRRIDSSRPWDERALAALTNFFCQQPREKSFLLEQVIARIGESCGEPRNGQAWGPVIKKAEKADIIDAAGFKLAANGRPATLWKRGPAT